MHRLITLIYSIKGFSTSSVKKKTPFFRFVVNVFLFLTNIFVTDFLKAEENIKKINICFIVVAIVKLSQMSFFLVLHFF